MNGYLLIAFAILALPLSVLPLRMFNTGYFAKTALWAMYLALSVAPTMWMGRGGEHDLELLGLSGLMIVLAIAYGAEVNTWRKNGEQLHLSANGFMLFIAQPLYYIAATYTMSKAIENQGWSFGLTLSALYLISLIVFKMINKGPATNLLQPLLISYPSALAGFMFFSSPLGLLCGLPMFVVTYVADYIMRPKTK